jgi:very-short-patch-repair endonuclease
MSDSQKHVWAGESDEDRKAFAEKISASEKGKIVSAAARINISNAHKGKRHSQKTEFTSEGMKAKYQDPQYVEKMRKAWNIKPNKAETLMLKLLDALYPGEWKYTGDFSFTINGKCPDFVNCNGKKLIIEYFGDHWHQGENPDDRAAAFSPFGYKTLVVWGSEMKSIGNVINRIHSFMGD